MYITNKRAWLWSHDCFKILPFVVLQRVARVCQRQLTYLLFLVLLFFFCFGSVRQIKLATRTRQLSVARKYIVSYGIC